ncbi:hypothetical protein PV325_013371 [Microctonus aethiopoides]|nr:hypothetical protein PV325_013371 [Microctonus aethiopoides]
MDLAQDIETRMRVASQYHLPPAIEKVTIADAAYRRKNKPKFMNGTINAMDGVSQLALEDNEEVLEIRAGNDKRPTKRFMGPCYNCKKVGHYFYECPEPRRVKTAPKPEKTPENNKKIKPIGIEPNSSSSDSGNE